MKFSTFGVIAKPLEVFAKARHSIPTSPLKNTNPKMPNKKSRNKLLPAIEHDLPPTKKSRSTNLSQRKERIHTKKQRKRAGKDDDDTPKAFARLMAIASGKQGRISGLDDGEEKRKGPKSNKRKRGEEDAKRAGEEQWSKDNLKIEPNESLKAFARRVDASIPVAFPRHRSGPDLKSKAKKKSEEKAQQPEKEEDDDEEGSGQKRRKRRKGEPRRQRSPDPWAVLEAKRAAPKFGEVAKGPPPKLTAPKALLSKGRVSVDGVPKSAGSLAQRAGLAEERKGVVDAYRRMVEQKRGATT